MREEKRIVLFCGVNKKMFFFPFVWRKYNMSLRLLGLPAIVIDEGNTGIATSVLIEWGPFSYLEIQPVFFERRDSHENHR